MTREWRKLHNEEVNDLHSSLIIFWGDQLEKNEVGGMQHVWGRVEVYTGRWWRDRGEKNHFGDPGVDGRIILKWIFRRWGVMAWTGSIWLRTGTGGGHL